MPHDLLARPGISAGGEHCSACSFRWAFLFYGSAEEEPPSFTDGWVAPVQGTPRKLLRVPAAALTNYRGINHDQINQPKEPPADHL